MKTLLVSLAPLSVASFVSQTLPLSWTRGRLLQQEDALVRFVARRNEWDQEDVPVADPDEPLPTPSGRKQVIMSPAIPFLECPPVLVDCSMAGNVGFDPLGFAKTKEDLLVMREAEIRHSRLAMLVCSSIGVWVLLSLVFFVSHVFDAGCRGLAAK